MEPVSQAVLGIMGQGLVTKKTKISLLKKSFWGALGGMAPDLDYIIRVSDDPLFTIEYHRQFTHSLFFIPFGALFVSLFLRIFKINIKDSYPYVLLGFATHGLLDAFTNYGTQLWWPFSDKREAWNCVAVLDPFLTLPLILLTYLFIKKQKVIFNYLAWCFLCSYLTLGYYFKIHIESLFINENIINQETIRFMIKPTIGNNFVWRVILEDENDLSFYGVRLGLFSKDIIIKGDRVRKVKDSEVITLLAQNPIQLNDYKRFKYFSDSYLFWLNEYEIADGRYSIIPHEKRPIWFIRVSPNELKHIEYVTNNRIDKETKEVVKAYFTGEGLSL